MIGPRWEAFVEERRDGGARKTGDSAHCEKRMVSRYPVPGAIIVSSAVKTRERRNWERRMETSCIWRSFCAQEVRARRRLREGIERDGAG